MKKRQFILAADYKLRQESLYTFNILGISSVRHEFFTWLCMNKPGKTDKNFKKLFQPVAKKQMTKSDQVHLPVQKNKHMVYPNVVMPEQPHGFIKAKKHNIF